jgi:peptidoglycan/xylan/chitin deacetylase (PgdA/CDA1 family)
MTKKILLAFLMLNASLCFSQKKVPDKIVVLTFDDASQSHYSYVAPLLRKYGFGATFYICEYPPDFSDTLAYMSWYDIKQLSDMGFEIGSQGWHHARVDQISNDSLKSELHYIERKCDSMKIPKPTSFAYPGYATDAAKNPVLNRLGYSTARVGGNRTYNPVYDNPYYIPSFILHAHNEQEIIDAFATAKEGHVVVLTVHGVPDLAHEALSTTQDVFENCMKFLNDNHFTVISMRSLTGYVK